MHPLVKTLEGRNIARKGRFLLAGISDNEKKIRDLEHDSYFQQ